MVEGPILAVIFDMDGTLTAPGLIDFPGIRRDIACPPGEDILTHVAHLTQADPAAAARAWEVIEAYEVAAVDTVAPAPGLSATLDALAERGLPLGILTRNSRRSTLETLARLHLTDRFQHLVAREDALPKPDPAGVLKATAELGVPPARTLVVGDYRHDVTAGHRAGAWAAWLRTRSEEPVPEHTDFVITSLTMVLPIVDGVPTAWSAPIKVSQRGR